LEAVTYFKQYFSAIEASDTVIITFKLNGESYQTENGKTWKEFATANPNVGVKIVLCDTNLVEHPHFDGYCIYNNLTGENVNNDDIILPEDYYAD
jgi:hypothetical protein